MGTLGRYLQDARNDRGIDLREAAQQTRISIQYLKALESEDFSKLPGEVFVKGFLKNYGKFLSLEESEVMKRYAELRQKPAIPAPAVQPEPSVSVAGAAKSPSAKLSVEPFIWAAGIIVLLVAFLFTALPRRNHGEIHQPEIASSPAGTAEGLASGPAPTIGSDKLYLEVIALDNTWLLVRTDDSPQKKALLNKGETLIWSADKRFVLSYGSAGAIKLLLNGEELTVNEPKNTVIRDLVVTAAGVENRKIQAEQLRPIKPKTPLTQQTTSAGPAVHAHRDLPSGTPKKPSISSAPRTAPSGTEEKKSPAARPTMPAKQKTEPTVTHQALTSSTSTAEQHTAPSVTQQKKSP